MHARLLSRPVVPFLIVMIPLFVKTLFAGATEQDTSAHAAIESMRRAVEAGDTTTMRSLVAPELRLFITEKTKQNASSGPAWLASFCRMIQKGTRVHFEVEWQESGQDGD